MALLPSSQSNAMFGLDDVMKSTRLEQLTQIEKADEQIRQLAQMLESSDITDAFLQILNDGQDVSSVVEVALNYEVPDRFTQDYGTMSTEEYAALSKDRVEYLEQLDRDIEDLSADVAIDEDEESVMVEIASLSFAPPSDISATQAQILQDAAKIEEDKRKKALEILRNRRDDIREQVVAGDQKANSAAMKCFWDSKKCGY